MLFRLAMRNIVRNVRRTALTAGTVLIGTALFVVAVAWTNGIFGGMLADLTAVGGDLQIVDREWAEKEILQPTYANLADVKALTDAVAALDGVDQVEPRIAVGVVVTADDEIGDHFARVVGANATYFEQRFRGADKLLQGTWLGGGPEEVVLGRKVANDVGATVGDRILLLGQTQYGSMAPFAATVVGVVGSDAATDQSAYVRLEDAQWMLDLDGGALEVLAWADGADADTLRAIEARVGALPEMEGNVVSSWFTREPMKSFLPVTRSMNAFLAFLVVFVTSLAIFNTMTMSVMERTSEIGVMRSMGLSRVEALRLLVTEALTIGLAGGVVGALVGSGFAQWLEVHGVTLSENLTARMGTAFPVKNTFYADLTPGVAAAGIALGIVIAAVGALLPALRASSIQPVTAMQSKR
jgi:ABC-type lipoprotein release transport system permease subunit